MLLPHHVLKKKKHQKQKIKQQKMHGEYKILLGNYYQMKLMLENLLTLLCLFDLLDPKNLTYLFYFTD